MPFAKSAKATPTYFGSLTGALVSTVRIGEMIRILIAFLLTLGPSVLYAEELQGLPAHLLGQWNEVLSKDDYNAGCSSARVRVSGISLVENPKYCGEGSRREARFTIHTIIKNESFFGKGVTYSLIGKFQGMEPDFTWVFETEENSAEAYVHVTDPTESGSRAVGTFRKQL